MDYVKYDFGFMFAYSERPGTLAEKKMEDGIPLATKKRRLTEIITKQMEHSLVRMQENVGKTFEVLIDGTSKKNENEWKGRNSQNAVIVFPKTGSEIIGDFIQVKVNPRTSATLNGIISNQ